MICADSLQSSALCASIVFYMTNVRDCNMVLQTYLPSEVPLPLRKYIEEELVELRGDGKRKLEEWDRVYDYAYYNDLGDPGKGSEYVRPIMGGSTEYPYPRRGRTGRPPTETGKRLTYDAFLFTFGVVSLTTVQVDMLIWILTNVMIAENFLIL